MFQKLSALVLLLAAVPSAFAGTYTLSNNFQGEDFFNDWSFQAISDPTHGRVNYVSQSTAQSLGLAYVSGSNFFMKADDTTVLSASGLGRNSIRLQSNQQYTQSVVIWNINHMPTGCGTWPAAWTVGGNWPNEGEIDVIEGVNNQEPNQATLHTASGCNMPSSGRGESGYPGSLDCEGNTGCGVQADAPNSFGPDFNNIGGGVYAMERNSDYIRVWFWARNDGSIPSDVSSGSSTINTSNWPTPFANFPNTDCNIPNFFGPHNLIFDLTFCGDWAGQSSVYAASGCPSTCVDYVNNNPSAFSNAYWDVAYVKVFE